MTDSYVYAATYGNGKVAEVTIPKITLEQMQYNGDLCTMMGQNLTGGYITGKEFMFSPQVKTGIVIRFKF